MERLVFFSIFLLYYKNRLRNHFQKLCRKTARFGSSMMEVVSARMITSMNRISNGTSLVPNETIFKPFTNLWFDVSGKNLGLFVTFEHYKQHGTKTIVYFSRIILGDGEIFVFLCFSCRFVLKV